MMTAGQIAEQLGSKEVVINYRAAEFISTGVTIKGNHFPLYDHPPMPDTELFKYNYDFSKMQKEGP